MNFNENWNDLDAILNLYFSDRKTSQKNGSHYRALANTVRHSLAGTTYLNEEINDEERELINKMVHAVHPSQSERSKKPWHALLWLRWAIQRSHTPSSHTLRCFSKWRDNHPEPGIWVIRYTKLNQLNSSGKVRYSKVFGKIHGFTLDEFLLTPNLSIGDAKVENLYQLRWTLSRIPRIPQSSDTRKPKLRKNKYDDHHGMQQDCGTNVFNEVIQCVTKAASKGLFFLSPKRKSGRFPCKLSRLDLANGLKKKYNTLERYAPETIARAISAIASCPRGNTKKSRPTLKKRR